MAAPKSLLYNVGVLFLWVVNGDNVRAVKLFFLQIKIVVKKSQSREYETDIKGKGYVRLFNGGLLISLYVTYPFVTFILKSLADLVENSLEISL